MFRLTRDLYRKGSGGKGGVRTRCLSGAHSIKRQRIELYRQELIRQRDLLQGAWRGLNTYVRALAPLALCQVAPAGATLELRTMGLATFIMGFVLVGKLNQLVARKLTDRINRLK